MNFCLLNVSLFFSYCLFICVRVSERLQHQKKKKKNIQKKKKKQRTEQSRRQDHDERKRVF